MATTPVIPIKPTDPNIEDITTEPSDPRFRCNACGGRPMSAYEHHIKSLPHQRKVQKFLARQAAEEQLLVGLEAQESTETHTPLTPFIDEVDHMEHERDPSESREIPPSPLSYLRSLDPSDDIAQGFLYDDNLSDGSDINFNQLGRAFDALADNPDNEYGASSDEEKPIDRNQARSKTQESTAWYPFKSKEQVVGLLIIGSTRNLLSRTQYERIRAILRICDVILPAWGTLRDVCKHLKSKLDLNLSERSSPSGTPLFGMSVKTIITNELANPIVRPNIVFVPELPHDGQINRLSQSKKWRECYSPDLRVQMVVVNNQHFYIYEPVKLCSGQLVVPMFFFQHDNKLKAKCLPASIQYNISDTNHLNIIIPKEPDFNSDEFYTIEVETFAKTFKDIILDNGVYLSKVCGSNMYQHHEMGVVTQPLQNPWREKADGKVIRHVPITLYSDDTSGNVSKKWNKHMSIYFTLSGLAPEWTNQEFNIHFLATSNSASALELFDEVVDDLNEYGENGFVAYDDSLGEDVLVMVVVLCHLGDSPMHAEICNTTNPSITLTPCRMCELKVTRMIDKEEEQFVRDFLCLNKNGEKVNLPPRKWDVTKSRTEELWELAQKNHSKTQVEEKARAYGIRDPINDFYAKKVQVAHTKLPSCEVEKLCKELKDSKGLKLFNPMLRLKGFDGHRDTPVEVLHVVLLGITKYLFRDLMKGLSPMKPGSQKFNYISARWRNFSSSGLKIPTIQPANLIQYYQSLVGKDFRTILQTVPFVLFDYMTKEQRDLWLSLCLLSSYIFQTEISDMKAYLAEVDNHIDSFLNQLINFTAQWVNKPKFHMLRHLQESIRLFGPACLFATEKMESYNGNLRDASVHSNKQSPSQDIANTFNTEVMLRLLISGSTFFDKELHTRVTAGPRVTSLFTTVPQLKQAMGLNENPKRISQFTEGRTVKPTVTPPPCLPNSIDGAKLVCIESVTLPSRQTVHPLDFVLLSNLTIAQVESIWKPDGQSATKTLMVLKQCQKGRLVPFYGMREILRSNHEMVKSVRYVQTVLNVQHNCHEGKCSVKMSKSKKIERKICDVEVPHISHTNNSSFILNLASQYSAELHRKLADVILNAVTPAQWNQSIAHGLKVWHEKPPPNKKQKTTNTPASTEVPRSSAVTYSQALQSSLAQFSS